MRIGFLTADRVDAAVAYTNTVHGALIETLQFASLTVPLPRIHSNAR